ncbi:ROK family protein [Lentisphaerota bacterium WC36G]|nr:ROK family protein [Lentisphaerae bacterium WC36]
MSSLNINVQDLIKIKPVLDPEFTPAVLWNKEYRRLVLENKNARAIKISLKRPRGTVSVFETAVFPNEEQYKEVNVKYIERLIKFLLWAKGGYEVVISGADDIAMAIKDIYSPTGARAFDFEIMGEKIYGKPFTVTASSLADSPQSEEISIKLGGNTDGCRIGFDLGGSDRKCAATIDGEVVHSEEVEWSPYFEQDPEWHLAGILDSLKRAAEKLPRVDAIGGSAAGVYVDNQVRIASLFRGVSEQDFKDKVVNIFDSCAAEYNNVPFIVANDGDVTALAGAISLDDTAVLGMSMGTSEAVGYVNGEGNITDWLNELAFAPVDYRDENNPIDEWSGDIGCGVQYFSQQCVARIAPAAGIDFPQEMPFPERLVEVQKLMEQKDERAVKIYQTIGVYFAYTIAHYAEFYEIKNLLILGRVTSGAGGNMILDIAEDVLKIEFPELAKNIHFRTPDEQFKRHGQAVIAATLPSLQA